MKIWKQFPILDAIETADESWKEVIKIWKQFSILDAIETADESWKEVATSTLNKSWRKLLPDMVAADPVVSDENEIVQEILSVDRNIRGVRFEDAEESEVLELILPDAEALAVEDVE